MFIASNFRLFFFLPLKNREKEEPKNTEIKSFQAPEIPPVYTDQRERAKYLVTHYWDKFNFADTSLIRMPEITEQAFVDFFAGVALCLVYRCRERDFRMLDEGHFRADTLMFAYFTELYDKYLYNPNSPDVERVNFHHSRAEIYREFRTVGEDR